LEKRIRKRSCGTTAPPITGLCESRQVSNSDNPCD
jgi:hypothetical protein